MDDDEFRSTIVRVIGGVVREPEVQRLAGSGKTFSFGAIDADVNWYIDTTLDPTFGEGIPDNRDVRVLMKKEDWLLTLQGKLSSTQAMLRKKLKLEGSMLAISSLSMDALVRVYNREVGESAA